MAQLEEALKLYKTLSGEEMPREQHKDLLSVKANLRLPDNDSLFAVFVALGHYLTMYKEIPLLIANERSSFEKMLEESKTSFSATINKCAEQAIENAGSIVIKNYQESIQKVKKDSVEELRIMFSEAAKVILDDNAKKIKEKTNDAYNKMLDAEINIHRYSHKKTLFIAALVALLLIVIGFVGGKYSEKISTPASQSKTQ
jgi:hypothetical protein